MSTENLSTKMKTNFRDCSLSTRLTNECCGVLANKEELIAIAKELEENHDFLVRMVMKQGVMMANQIIRNMIQTPDGTILESKTRHDYQTHTDENGEKYMVDGGTDYLRGNLNKEPAKALHVFSDDDHEVVRDSLLWGTYGLKGDQPLTWVSLADMSSDHIKSVILNCNIDNWRKEIYYRELLNREDL